MPELRAAVRAVIGRCLGVRSGEDVLVIVDPATRPIGEELRDAAAAAGADAVLAVMDERATDGTEPPRPLATALAACDVFIAPTSRSLSHTVARKQATDRGVRGATMPGVTEDMLARVMAADFPLMAARSRAVAALLDDGDAATVSCPRGTALRLDLTGRRGFADDGDLTASGAFGNLPCGEGFIAPRNGDGQIVASSLASLGLSEPPATLTVRAGRIVDAQGGLGPEYLAQLMRHGEADRQRARGREAARHRACRLRRQRRHRRHGGGADPPRCGHHRGQSRDRRATGAGSRQLGARARHCLGPAMRPSV
jgi:leucyl aminopeptidase (aminopeptidase T)